MVPFVIFLDGCIDFFPDGNDVFFGIFLWRNVQVTDNIRVARTGSKAEIVRMILGIFRLDQRIDIMLHGRDDFLVCAKGIHVDIDIDLEFFFQDVFQFVYGRMDFHNIRRIGYFHMNGSIRAPGTVVVDLQIVDADDIRTMQGAVGTPSDPESETYP